MRRAIRRANASNKMPAAKLQNGATMAANETK
jgi:hypothetical protein